MIYNPEAMRTALEVREPTKAVPAQTKAIAEGSEQLTKFVDDAPIANKSASDMLSKVRSAFTKSSSGLTDAPDVIGKASSGAYSKVRAKTSQALGSLHQAIVHLGNKIDVPSELPKAAGEATIANLRSTASIADALQREVASVFGAARENRELIKSNSILARMVGPLAMRLANLYETMQDRGMIDAGSIGENFKNGVAYVMGHRVDIDAIGLNLLINNTSVLVEKRNRGMLDAAWDAKAEEVDVVEFVLELYQGTSIDWDPSVFTHAEVFVTGTPGIYQLVRLEDALAASGKKPGDVISTADFGLNHVQKDYESVRFHYSAHVAMTQNLSSLVTLGAAIGAQSYSNLFSKLIPFFPQPVQTLFMDEVGTSFALNA